MTQGRADSNPDPRTTAETPARRSGRFGALLAVGVAAAAGAAVLGPATAEPASVALPAVSSDDAMLSPVQAQLAESARENAAKASRASRSSERDAPEAVEPESVEGEAADLEDVESEDADPEVVGTRYTEVPLNVRTGPDVDADLVTVLERGARVRITDEKQDGWQQIVRKGDVQWVKAEFLSKSKPAAEPEGLSTAPCPTGSGVESGLGSHAVAVHRAVCALFPQVDSYGGLRGGGGNHGRGLALDIMITGSVGDRIAAFLRENASELGVTEVIWEQRIWTVQRAGDGWRWMEDRGGATANHYDHVHVSVR